MGKSLLRFADFVDNFTEHIKWCSFIVVIMMLLVVVDIVIRSVFLGSTTWAWPVNRQLMAALFVMAGAYTMLHRGHLRMDALSNRWSGRTQAIMELATSFLPLIFCGALVWFGGQLAWRAISIAEQIKSGALSNIPVAPIRVVFFIGMFLLLLQIVVGLIRNLFALVHKDMSEYNE